MTLYDYTGRAVAYSDDGETIYLFSGMPVAYFYGELVYGFGGQQLGTIQHGWIRDNEGFCVFFTENAVGGPVKPIKQTEPIKCVKQINPIKSIRHIPLVRAVDQSGWSNLHGESFFSSI